MRYGKIPGIESGFKQTLIAGGKKFKQVEGVFPYVIGLQAPKTTHYLDKKLKKKFIVCHNTCGVLTGDIATLTENTVSTAFVLARDGTAYQLFHPDYSAYHLGIGEGYRNSEASFSSIGIEISNIGPLKKNGDRLVDIYGKDYCSTSTTEAYAAVSYRGYEYFASYTTEQYSTLKRLVADLSGKYSIPNTLLPESVRFETVPGKVLAGAAGVVSHVNFRREKLDLAPNFDWSRLQ
jgi:N-acetylmuramoyl-L-alanine amidase